MKRRIFGDSLSGAGEFTLELDQGPVSGQLVTEGASVVISVRGDLEVVAAGVGRLAFDLVLLEPGQLVVRPFKASNISSLFLDKWPVDLAETGWVNGDAFVQLELKDRNAISPEVQAVLDKMQRNMLFREAQLRAQLAKLQG